MGLLTPVVIDNGTGYTKMGYAGNSAPLFVLPTAIATHGKGPLPSGASTTSSGTIAASSSSNQMGHGGLSKAAEDFDFLIGDEALAAAKHYNLQYPIRHGQVDNWDLMEAYWQHCFFRYLCCNPEQHMVLLTEPPLNAPENREYTAEIMFESFNVPGLYIAVQAVLALAASWFDGRATDKTDKPLTGTVIDAGDGVTHIIPVVEGYAIASAIKHAPLAGREMTLFIQQMLRDRADTGLAPEQTMEAARRIKEELCYVCPDIAREFLKYDQEPSKYISTLPWTDPKTTRTLNIKVGPERFLAPEIFFNPEMSQSATGASASAAISSSPSTPPHQTPLPLMLDEAIQACPIDCRRDLYRNIVLSGGSTMFKDFAKRLQRDVKSIVDERLAYTATLDAINKSAGSSTPQVNVVSHRNQRYAVWCGGSLFASLVPK